MLEKPGSRDDERDQRVAADDGEDAGQFGPFVWVSLTTFIRSAVSDIAYSLSGLLNSASQAVREVDSDSKSPKSKGKAKRR